MSSEYANNNFLYITGGGGLSDNCINVSTLSAIVTGSFGLPIIKHVSSQSSKRCSSVALLNELGIEISNSIYDIENNLAKNEIAFVDSLPEFVVGNVCPIIALPSCTSRLIGLNSSDNAMEYLFDLKDKKYKRALVVCSSDNNYDEASLVSSTQIFELKDGKISNYFLSPDVFSIPIAEAIELTGATPVYNMNLAVNIFSGNIKGAKLDVIAINSAIMLYVIGYVETIKEGIMASYVAIQNGQALKKLERLRGNLVD